MGSRSVSGQSNTSRPSLRDLTYVSQPTADCVPALHLDEAASALPAKKSRPISMMVRGLSAQTAPPPPRPPTLKENDPAEAKAEKRVSCRRGPIPR
jgi:hypothetical protein